MTLHLPGQPSSPPIGHPLTPNRRRRRRGKPAVHTPPPSSLLLLYNARTPKPQAQYRIQVLPRAPLTGKRHWKFRGHRAQIALPPTDLAISTPSHVSRRLECSTRGPLATARARPRLTIYQHTQVRIVRGAPAQQIRTSGQANTPFSGGLGSQVNHPGKTGDSPRGVAEWMSGWADRGATIGTIGRQLLVVCCPSHACMWPRLLCRLRAGWAAHESSSSPWPSNHTLGLEEAGTFLSHLGRKTPRLRRWQHPNIANLC